MASRALLVHDDREDTVLLGSFLAQNGFSVDHARELRRVIDCLDAQFFDAVLLDARSAGIDADRLLRRVRQHRATAAIVISTDPLAGATGPDPLVDEWLRPPWLLPDALARVQLALSRRALVIATQHVVAGDLVMDVGERKAHLAGKELALTALEFDLLASLARSAGTAVPRESLRSLAEGRRPSSSDRALDVHVCHLRAKLRKAGAGANPIRTVRRIGYLLALPARARIERARG